MKRAQLLFIPLALFSLTAAHAQTADEIIGKHIEAVGGKDKIEKITSVVMESTVEVMGNEAPAITTILYNKGAKSEVNFGGNKLIQTFTAKGGWSVNPMQGITTPSPMPESQYRLGKDAIYPEGGLLNYKVNNAKASLEGKEKIGTVDAYKIKVVASDSAETIYYIDPSTYYIIQILKQGDMNGQKMDILTTLSDFKKTESGHVVPYTTETHFGEQFTIIAHLKKIEENKAVDPAIFEMK